VAFPELCLATPDHYVPTTARSMDAITDKSVVRVLDDFRNNLDRSGIPTLSLDDSRQGLVHVVGPEQGFTLPGTTMVCGDSHTTTHGALGALAFGIGASEVAHVLATQCLWQMKPKSMRVTVEGQLPAGVFAKDLALAIIGAIGTAGAAGHVVEYAGTGVAKLSIEERCTLCNMTIEAGAKAGMVAPDDVTFAYLDGRPLVPAGADWDAAVRYWRTLTTDEGAGFDKEFVIDGANVQPMVTWGTNPEQSVAIDGLVPDPRDALSEDKARSAAKALDYMALSAGQKMSDVPIDQVFIGTCTNGRIEDLRAAARVVARIGGRAQLPALVSPGSRQVKRMAEDEGLDAIFIEAGFDWRDSGCSMCVGMNGDLVPPGKRCVSTSNRNFEGRQGRDSRTHLVSPATAAATAMLGRLADARESWG
jgi:3-isopropylmalate/(R)-2-methylmalate dehydratase large subunit